MIAWVNSPTRWRQLLMLVGDVLVIVAVIGVGVLLDIQRGADSRIGGVPAEYLVAAALIVVQLTMFYVLNLYDLSIPSFPKVRGLIRVGVGTLVTIVIASSLLFFANDRGPGRLLLLTYFVGASFGFHVWRVFFFARLRKVASPLRLGLVGADPAVGALCKDLVQTPIQAYEVVAVFVENPAEDHTVHRMADGRHICCTPDDLRETVAGADLDVLVFSITGDLSCELLQALFKIRLQGLEILDLPTFQGRLVGRHSVESIDSRWVLESLSRASHPTAMENFSRVLEVGFASALILVLSPIMAVIAAAVKLTSPGPVLFRQERLGRREEPFTLLKFRTMKEDAESDSGPTWTVAGDPRITSVGEFLRKTGLDELPQLVNIVRGEMSFVGPRPIRRHFADLLDDKIPYYRLRFLVRPGVTGWAQVRHDYAGTIAGQIRKFEYELFNVRHNSPFLAALVILKTIQKLLFRKVNDVRQSHGEQPQGEPLQTYP